MDKPYNVGIIGAGVSGVVTALHLANLGISTVLLEQKANIIGGPPFCHLHAGGNLYPDISDEQCRILLRQSIEMARLFPQSIDQRPTLLSVPKTYNLQPERIEKRLKMLVREYEQLIQEDPKNQILGHPHDYYRSYSQKELRNLLSQPLSPSPQSLRIGFAMR